MLIILKTEKRHGDEKPCLFLCSALCCVRIAGKEAEKLEFGKGIWLYA